jgi:hypothetical protein
VRGSNELSRLMPSGIPASDAPWMARPTINNPRLVVTASNSEPTVRAATATSSNRRLPNMSPRRPNVGTATAPTSSVEVSNHSTFAADVCSCSGRIGSTGTSSVCDSDTINAARPTTSTSSRARPDDVVTGSVRVASATLRA